MTGNDEKRPPIDEELFLTAARSTLDDSVERLDADTRSRLVHIRSQAVQAAGMPRAARMNRWLVPAGGGLAAAAALLLVVALGPDRPSSLDLQQPKPMAVLEDLQILTDSEEIEFYQNLEFYEWLAAREQDVS
ncbi:MAG: hypothetical protein PVF34_06640 [Gammaproteobacteria bacterium]|jgi:hypothetical protein